MEEPSERKNIKINEGRHSSERRSEGGKKEGEEREGGEDRGMTRSGGGLAEGRRQERC